MKPVRLLITFLFVASLGACSGNTGAGFQVNPRGLETEPTPEPENSPTPDPGLNLCGCDDATQTLAGRELSTVVNSHGSSITSATLEVNTDGQLRMTLAPILGLDGIPYQDTDRDKIFVNVEVLAAGIPYSCEFPPDFGAGAESKADIAFLVDTTGSMGVAVTGISNSIQQFAQDLETNNLDVNYSMVTFGDAYNTKAPTGSSYVIGTGDDAPPAFDPTERPMLNFTDDFTMFNDFIEEVKTVVGSGAGGRGGPENYYGVAAAMAGKQTAQGQPGLIRREGVPFYEILVGDNCGYISDAGAYPNEPQGKWTPPLKSEVDTILGGGDVTVHAVRSNDYDSLECLADPTQFISLDEIADATGGAKLDMGPGGDANLLDIGLQNFIINFWLVDVESSCVADQDTFLIGLTLRVDDGGGNPPRVQFFTFNVTVI